MAHIYNSPTLPPYAKPFVSEQLSAFGISGSCVKNLGCGAAQELNNLGYILQITVKFRYYKVNVEF